MFYVLSKVIFPLIAPSNFSLVLIGIGLALRLFERWRRWGGRVALAGFVLLAAWKTPPWLVVIAMVSGSIAVGILV